MPADQLVPAAQYLRMSTEHQQYSLQNQAAAIQKYAEFSGFEIVQTYADPARSGVVLKRRQGLQQLLKDVIGGQITFRAILVYDVSRWGRFQDTDEAAHYEFLCKSAKIPVHYCGETFANDGALPNMIMKSLKRMMAGEYSRELGVKVYSGLRRLAKLGFKVGGESGYGLRRMLVAPNRLPKHKLNSGEAKSLATDRVILVPGPAHEVKVVRDIYRMLIHDGYSVRRIANELNRKGTRFRPGSTWSYAAVYGVLTHSKYIGTYEYGRTSSRLYTPLIRLPKSDWILTPHAFEAMVDYPTFAQAQHILYRRSLNKSKEEMLDGLKGLLNRCGRLSGALIAADANIPSPSTYCARFGSLRRTYELIGYGRSEDFGPKELRRRTQALRDEVIARLAEMFPNHLSIASRGGKWRRQLRMKTGELVSVLIVRRVYRTSGTIRWILQPAPHERDNITLLARYDTENRSLMDLHLVPNLDRPGRFYLKQTDDWFNRGVHLAGLSDFVAAMKTLGGKNAMKTRLD